MKECVYEVPAADKGKLQKILDENPFADDSFAKTGYYLKESSALGLQPGKYFLYFKAEETLAKKLEEKLKALETAKEASKEDKEKAIAEIKKGEESAASGFGSIFQ